MDQTHQTCTSEQPENTTPPLGRYIEHPSEYNPELTSDPLQSEGIPISEEDLNKMLGVTEDEIVKMSPCDWIVEQQENAANANVDHKGTAIAARKPQAANKLQAAGPLAHPPRPQLPKMVATSLIVSIVGVLLSGAQLAVGISGLSQQPSPGKDSELEQAARWIHCNVRNETQFPIIPTGHYFGSGRYEKSPSYINSFSMMSFSGRNKSGSIMTGISAGASYQIVLEDNVRVYFALGFTSPWSGGYKTAVVLSKSPIDGHNAASLEGGYVETPETYQGKDKDGNRVKVRFLFGAATGKRGFAPNISLEPISGSVDVVSPEDNDIPVEIPHNIPENQDSSPISPSGTSNLAIPKSPITPSSKPVLPKLVVPDSTPRSNISTPISAASSHTSVGFSTLEDQSSSPGVSPIVDNSVRVLPTKVRALCDVTGTEPGELSFKKGDIIEVDVRTSAEIWHGKVNDTSGTFQLNFSVEPILKERVRALWDFVSAAPEDLSFKSGDIIQVYGPSSSSTWWWHGLIQGKGIGTFPYNFVEPLEDEFADSEDEGADIVKSSIPKTLARFRVLKDVVAIEEGMLNLKRGDILELVSKQSHEKWLGRSRSQTGTFFLDENIEPIMTNKVKALYDFTSSNPGELTFKANDIITV
ncbi:hypothetical protein FRC17_009663, partial [Serendipita sp. 399]